MRNFQITLRSGFSLIELLLVVAILLTLSTGSAIFYSRFFLQSSVANTADRLVGTIRKAQIYSMTGKQNDSWSVNYSADTITLYKGSSFGSRNSEFDEKFSVGSNISLTGFTDITFDRLTGVPNSAVSISISAGGNNKTVTVNSQGALTRQ